MSDRLRLFLGYDVRETVGYHVCLQSLLDTTSIPCSITAISGEQRDGSNAFIYTRFLVPQLCGFEGWAIFADGSDMLFREDIAELWSLREEYSWAALAVVKREYKTRQSRKYIGTPMESVNEDYPRKNWSSLMLINCGHPANRVLTQEFVASHGGNYLHRFSWLEDQQIAPLPERWNVLVGEDGEDAERCSLAHFTLGIPAMARYSSGRYSGEWWQTLHRLNQTEGKRK